MTDRGVAIKYGDVAPEAKENFIPTSPDSAFDTLAQLQEYNLNVQNYGNPCELYSVILDGNAVPFPPDPTTANIGLISQRITNDLGLFVNENGNAAPVKLTLTSAGQYSSIGLTLTFDTYNQIFCTDLHIEWYRNGSKIDEEDFIPDNAFYFCNKKVENYDKIILLFRSLNMPKNRLRLFAIDYGYGTYFYGNELRNVKLIQQIDPISSEISIDTADFTLDSKSNLEYSFQRKQPLNIYFNGQLKATTFVKSSKRKARFLWDVQSEDYIGLMDSMTFYGGMYVDENVVELLDDIFNWQEEKQETQIPYYIDESLRDMTVSGHIPICTRREALMQVAFAIQAIVDTSDSDVVNIYSPQDDIKQTIPLNRIMQGQNFVDDETVTDVEVVLHRYEPKDTTNDNKIVVYNAREEGTGQNIFVKFDEPLHSLSVLNANPSELVQYNANYAIISPQSKSFKLIGYGYDHVTETHRKHNDVVLASEVEKAVSIESATLVSPANIDNVLEKCYNWLIKTNTTNLSIIEGKHIIEGGYVRYGQRKYGTFRYCQKAPDVVEYDEIVNLGEVVSAETEYLGDVTGRLIKQSFNLNGGIIVKEAVLK